jgi:dTDP-4-amino-4,6-dideoxygalactose transaminase
MIKALFKQLEHLAPAGGFPSPGEVLSVLRRNQFDLQRLETRTASLLGASGTGGSFAFFGSGSEALLHLFKAAKVATRRSIVAMSAYTCPDVAVAAIRAGCRVWPLEPDERNFAIHSSDRLEAELGRVAVVVLSNLYGIAEPLNEWIKASHTKGFVLVDDACQAALSSRDGFTVGSSPDVFGIFSFGRGKALCGIGGGAIRLPPGRPGSVLGDIAAGITKAAGENGGRRNVVRDFAKLSAIYLLERPELYSIPANIPALELGKTRIELDFDLQATTPVEFAAAIVQLQSADRERSIRVRNANAWSSALSRFSNLLSLPEISVEDVPLRYPVLLHSDSLKTRLGPVLERFGVSGSYPRSLSGYREIASSLISSATNAADSIAARVLTFPVHRHVRSEHIDAACDAIEKAIR